MFQSRVSKLKRFGNHLKQLKNLIHYNTQILYFFWLNMYWTTDFSFEFSNLTNYMIQKINDINNIKYKRSYLKNRCSDWLRFCFSPYICDRFHIYLKDYVFKLSHAKNAPVLSKKVSVLFCDYGKLLRKIYNFKVSFYNSSDI